MLLSGTTPIRRPLSWPPTSRSSTECNVRSTRRHVPTGTDSALPGRAYQVNVTDPGHVQQSVDQIVKEFNGRLDVFVANAGVTWQQGPAIDGKVDHYRKVVTTDLDSVFYTAQAAGKHFCRQKDEGTDLDGKKLEHFVGGSFIATASMSGHIANIPQMQAAYNAAKAGVMQLCRSGRERLCCGRADTSRQISCGRVGSLRQVRRILPPSDSFNGNADEL